MRRMQLPHIRVLIAQLVMRTIPMHALPNGPFASAILLAVALIAAPLAADAGPPRHPAGRYERAAPRGGYYHGGGYDRGGGNNTGALLGGAILGLGVGALIGGALAQQSYAPPPGAYYPPPPPGAAYGAPPGAYYP